VHVARGEEVIVGRTRLARCSWCWLLIVAAPASAAWLTASDIEEHCAELATDAQSRSGVLCAAFIQGVIAGERVVNRGSAMQRQPESFTERAARTRAGSRLRPTRDRPWCIDPTLPAATVLESVAARIPAIRAATDGSAARDDDTAAAQLVRQALAASFPCSDP
jgi:hypothetical protein